MKKRILTTAGGNRYIYWCEGKKTVYEHRRVMEQFLGRELESWEYIHHINENTLDNRLENLRLMSSHCHQALHHVIPTWAKKYESCTRCGGTETRHVGHGLCVTCYNFMYVRHMKKHRKIKPKTKWSLRYGDCCSNCGSDQFPHRARGLCNPCYRRKFPWKRPSRP